MTGEHHLVGLIAVARPQLTTWWRRCLIYDAFDRRPELDALSKPSSEPLHVTLAAAAHRTPRALTVNGQEAVVRKEANECLGRKQGASGPEACSRSAAPQGTVTALAEPRAQP